MAHSIPDDFIELPPSYPSIEREQELLRELRTDDPDRVARAFTELVQPLLPTLHGLAGARLRDDREGEDAVQDALLHFWKHCGRLVIQKRLAHYLCVTVNNAVTDRLRRQRVEERYAAELARELRRQEAAAWVLPFDETLFDEEAKRHIELALAQLTPIRRDVWMMRQYKGVSCEDMAAAFGVVVNTVRQHLWQANLHIKAVLTQAGVLDRYPMPARGRGARARAALRSGAPQLPPPRPTDPLITDLSVQRPMAEERMISQESDSDA